MAIAANPARYLAEVAEGSASGETARIYAEIRRLTGVPFVALIYRHLATIPHALEALWRAVGHRLQSGELQECAWRIGRDAWKGPAADLPDDVRSLGNEELARIGDVIDAYNRANPVNFAIVCALSAMPPTPAARRTSRANWTPPPAMPGLPPIAPVAGLPPAVRKHVDAFGKTGSAGMPVLVPTLYRHLAHWPDFLALAHREVQPRLAAGLFRTAIDDFRIAIQTEAASFACNRAMVTDPVLRSVAPVFERFTGVIPEMVVVGSFLSRTLRQT